MNPGNRFQFGLRSLLLVTTVVALVLALLRPLNLPPVLHFLLAGYTITMIPYFLLRGFAQIRRAYRLERQCLAKRQALQTWLEEKRQQARPTSREESGVQLDGAACDPTRLPRPNEERGTLEPTPDKQFPRSALGRG